eukprot:8078279-Lingulodinium_polyedra.AAC.1
MSPGRPAQGGAGSPVNALPAHPAPCLLRSLCDGHLLGLALAPLLLVPSHVADALSALHALHPARVL